MKTILVPTDFSECANNALAYAAHLAEELKAKITLLHVFWTPVYEFDTRQEVQSKEKNFREYAHQQLQKLEKKLLVEHPELKLDVIVRNGIAADEIVRMAHVHRVFLTVMGTKGASGLQEIFMGSTTAEVIEKADCPILAIPQTAHWQGIRHIVAAIDYHDSDLPTLTELSELAEAYGARLTLLHQPVGEPSTEESTVLHRLTRNVRKLTAHSNTDSMLLAGNDLLESLNEYLMHHPTDLLAMSTRKRGFFARTFGKSYTRKMVHHTHLPLLAFQAYDLPQQSV